MNFYQEILFAYIPKRHNFQIEIKVIWRNADLIVYINKKDTLKPFKESQDNFVEKKLWTVAEFMKTCDELVIASKYDHYSRTIIS